MRHGADVVHVQDVDAIEAESLEAVLERPHDTVIAVVVDEVERHGRQEAVTRGCVAGRFEQTPDLGRQNVILSLTVPQGIAHAAFAQSLSVMGRRVEIPKSLRPGSIENLRSLGVAYCVIQVAERRTAEAEHVDGESGCSNAACFHDLQAIQ